MKAFLINGEIGNKFKTVSLNYILWLRFGLKTFHFCLFYGLLIINTFFKAKSTKTTTTHFQLNLSVSSYIKLLLVFIDFSKTGDK